MRALLIQPKTIEEFNSWEIIANKLDLPLEEYVRLCTSAHTNILNRDSFNFVADRAKEKMNKRYCSSTGRATVL